jgi:hypothetical protein
MDPASVGASGSLRLILALRRRRASTRPAALLDPHGIDRRIPALPPDYRYGTEGQRFESSRARLGEPRGCGAFDVLGGAPARWSAGSTSRKVPKLCGYDCSWPASWRGVRTVRSAPYGEVRRRAAVWRGARRADQDRDEDARIDDDTNHPSRAALGARRPAPRRPRLRILPRSAG